MSLPSFYVLAHYLTDTAEKLSINDTLAVVFGITATVVGVIAVIATIMTRGPRNRVREG